MIVVQLLPILDGLLQREVVDMHDHISSLVMVIRRYYESQCGHLQIKHAILPSYADRQKALVQSQGLCARLLRLMTQTTNFTLRDSIASLYFEVSDRNPNKLIDNIGYGFAAGFLSALPLSGGAHQIPSLSQGENNPVTGQSTRAEDEEKALQSKATIEMTDEEKEQEAERLFVLFDRLNRNGIIKVKNPAHM